MRDIERLRKLSAAFSALPVDAIVVLPEDDWEFVFDAVRQNAERLKRPVWNGPKGGILFRGREVFAHQEIFGG